MGIKDFLEKLRAKKLKYKEFEEDMKIQETYIERKKSSNERELERYKHAFREQKIKEELEKWRARDKYEMENTHKILQTKNMFDKEKPVILKEKSLFTTKSNLNTPGGLFFK